MPDSEELVGRAVADSTGGRHEAGLWLACQLRDNAFTLSDAEEIMRLYARQVDRPEDRYREGEAVNTVRSTYRTEAREPWPEEEEQAPRRHARRPQPVTSFKKLPPTVAPESVAKLHAALPTITTLEGSESAKYLESRGIPWALAGFAGVKHSGNWDNGGPAVVFPVRDGDGNLVAAQGRFIRERGFRTLGPRSLGLFGTERAFTADVCAIVEAPIDALTLAIAGLPTVAMCGASGLPDWFLRERGKTRRIDGMAVSRTTFIATDSDKAGEDAACALLGPLGATGTVCVRLKPPLKDWNAVLTTEGVNELCCLVDEVVWPEISYMLERPDPRPDLPDSSGWLKVAKVARGCQAALGLLRYMRASDE
jgi:hypothetical protein